MSYREVMDLPIKAFWEMNHQISRLLAEQDLRNLTVMNAAQSSEGSEDTRRALLNEMGEVTRAAPIRDQEAVNDLKALMVNLK